MLHYFQKKGIHILPLPILNSFLCHSDIPVWLRQKKKTFCLSGVIWSRPLQSLHWIFVLLFLRSQKIPGFYRLTKFTRMNYQRARFRDQTYWPRSIPIMSGCRAAVDWQWHHNQPSCGESLGLQSLVTLETGIIKHSWLSNCFFSFSSYQSHLL